MKQLGRTVGDLSSETAIAQTPKSGTEIRANTGTSAPVLTPRQLKMVVGGLMVGLFLAGLDGNIVATAMPTIAGKLGGFTKLAWVSTAYVVSSTIATPVLGKLSDLYGRRRIYLIAISAFLGGSVLCGLSQTIDQLIAARTIQGIGGGGIMSLSFAIVGQLVTPASVGSTWGTSLRCLPFPVLLAHSSVDG